ncbi:MAG: DNA polymerase III subunit epsilon [Steroidobacteraceae bacterium]
MRQIVLDTETTGLEAERGHRIIEIGCVEVVNRRATGRHLHHYIHPDRDIDAGAAAVHGITLEKLAGKPRFEQVAEEFLAFVDGAELVIHNAPFDVGFIDMEIKRWARISGKEAFSIRSRCGVLDTLALARELHPGQRNGLDALCKRYSIDNSHRQLHGALLDARILADVYLAMTGGQNSLALDEAVRAAGFASGGAQAAASRPAAPLAVVAASAEEVAAHDAFMEVIRKASGGKAIWTA